MSLSTLIMAAGASSRFGDIKQLQDIDGKTMLQGCINRYRQADAPDIWVVLGCNADQIKQTLEPTQNVLVAKNWQSGLGNSIATSVNKLAQHTDNILIGLADQVAITEDQIRLLIKQNIKTPGKIIAARYNGIAAVPAIFPQVFFSQLMALTGDQGARKIIEKNRRDVISIAMDTAATDIDTKDSLNLWYQNR